MNASRIEEDNYCCLRNERRGTELFFANHVIDEDNDVINTTRVLLQMYQGQRMELVQQNLQKVRLNPNWLSRRRDDLEYYIPQFINFLVFRDNDEQLIQFLFDACESNHYFAHLTYFTLKSLSQIVNKKILELKEVTDFLNDYTQIMKDLYQDRFLVNRSSLLTIGENSEKIQSYGTADFDISSDKINASQINVQQYCSIYKDPLNMQRQNNGFMSTIEFWDDIITISERLHLAYPQIISLKADLQRINQRLPSAVYVPFAQDQIRNYVILNIVAQESRVFSTKERSPFYICLELFRPDAEHDKQDDVKQSEAITLQRASVIHKTSVSGSMFSEQQKFSNIHKISIQHPLQVIDEDIVDETPTSLFYVPEDESEQKKSQYESFQGDSNEQFLSVRSSFEQEIQKKSMIMGPASQHLFGESSKDQTERIRNCSPFGNLKSWRLVHLIVKSGDNLKQEQFAMQLISTIDQIFATEKLPIKLSTYEVISLGPNYGLIEMVKDAITIDSLKRQLYDRGQTLSQFFDDNFSHGHRINLMLSLVGYSLACYIMQLKDRHNGNILLKRDGHLVHIDFGFFLGNAPGRGIELENKVPFKLMSEYIEILGGVESDLFKKFREFFYKGFLALRKHSDRILLLVKMMYSGHKNTMPCFKRGDKTITQLQERFYLDENDDAEINVICQNLINSSIDNWRAKWYDKYQYYFQGIFY